MKVLLEVFAIGLLSSSLCYYTQLLKNLSCRQQAFSRIIHLELLGTLDHIANVAKLKEQYSIRCQYRITQQQKYYRVQGASLIRTVKLNINAKI